ncbi:MAG: efflux RND transporter periplasmic adaptor subunit [Pseudomonadota bacterium]
MKKNLLTATVIAAALLLWLFSGLFVDTPSTAEDLADLTDASETEVIRDADARMRVRVASYAAEQRTLTRVLRGKTESKRTARISAETSGRVISRPVERGDRVSSGQLLCELATDDREAAVTEARALFSQAEIEFAGAQRLKDRGLLSDAGIAQVNTDLERARAQLTREELNLARTRVTAPFDGVIEQLHVDVGDYATTGTLCATLLDLDPMLIAASVSEQDIDFIQPGSPVTARTSTDKRVEGNVTFVGRQSDATTRTYPVEITVANPDYTLRAGLTTVVSVEAETVLAHRVSPALFTLDDAGVLGLRAVDKNNRVVFHPVEVIEDASNGAWVTGLPGIVQLITVGHEFVSAGQRVLVENEATPPATARR